MSKVWPMVALSEILAPVSRPESVDPQKNYRLLGARWYAGGLYVKETKPGSQIQAAKLYRVEENDFVYNRLFAWKGSFAIATNENDGCYVSNEFPVFAVNPELADGHYLWRYFSRAIAWDEALGLSTGGTPTSRNRLKEEKLLAMKIPLPSLDEQQQIVARIEELAAKIEDARELRQQALEEADRLLITMAHRVDLDEATKRREGWVEAAIGEVVREVSDAHTVQPEASYPNLGIYSFGRGLFHKPPIQGMTTSATKLYRVHAGQFIYSRLFAFEGSYGWVSDGFDGYFVSGEYPTFECDPERMRAQFLYAYFKSPSVWKKVAVGSIGLGDRRQRVKSEQLLSHRLMLPPLEWQDRICQVLEKVEGLKRLQSESAAELNALLPAILDKAFKGEL
jgi:type I restriction enzyme S subunit